MKRETIGRWLGYALGFPLVLLVFLMLAIMILWAPAELAVISAHLWRVSASTEATVLSSRVEHRKGNSKLVLRYRYVVDGRHVEATRIRAGIVSEHAFGHRQDELPLRDRPVAGESIVVHYDPDDPDFSLVAYGWSTFPIGWLFALAGIVLTQKRPIRGVSTNRGLVDAAARHAFLPTTLAVFALLPGVLPPDGLALLPICYLLGFVLCFAFAWLTRLRAA